MFETRTFLIPTPRSALRAIKAIFTNFQGTLSTLTGASDPATVQNICAESLSQISVSLPLLGFIIRSTNVRNNFGSTRPIAPAGVPTSGSGPKLILSSEWFLSILMSTRQNHQFPQFRVLSCRASGCEGNVRALFRFPVM